MSDRGSEQLSAMQLAIDACNRGRRGHVNLVDGHHHGHVGVEGDAQHLVRLWAKALDRIDHEQHHIAH